MQYIDEVVDKSSFDERCNGWNYMGIDRRQHTRESCEGKVVLRSPNAPGATDSLEVYLREKSSGGLSGTCFDCPRPRVNDFYHFKQDIDGCLQARVCWATTTVEGVHMVGFQLMRAPVAM